MVALEEGVLLPRGVGMLLPANELGVLEAREVKARMWSMGGLQPCKCSW